jgi:hypothetical protein
MMSEKQLKEANARALIIIESKAKEIHKLSKDLEKQKLMNKILLDKLYEYELRLEEERVNSEMYKSI